MIFGLRHQILIDLDSDSILLMHFIDFKNVQVENDKTKNKNAIILI